MRKNKGQLGRREEETKFTSAYTETVKFSTLPRRLLPNGCQYVNE
jgi:hypothetical protein